MCPTASPPVGSTSAGAPVSANAPPPADEGRCKREAEGGVADEDAKRQRGGGGGGADGAGGAGGEGGRDERGSRRGERGRGLLGAADGFDDEGGGEAEALRRGPLSRPSPTSPAGQRRPSG